MHRWFILQWISQQPMMTDMPQLLKCIIWGSRITRQHHNMYTSTEQRCLQVCIFSCFQHTKGWLQGIFNLSTSIHTLWNHARCWHVILPQHTIWAKHEIFKQAYTCTSMHNWFVSRLTRTRDSIHITEARFPLLITNTGHALCIHGDLKVVDAGMINETWCHRWTIYNYTVFFLINGLWHRKIPV